MEGPDSSRRRSKEGKQKASAEPIDDAGSGGVEFSGGISDCRKRQPLHIKS